LILNPIRYKDTEEDETCPREKRGGEMIMVTVKEVEVVQE
jgi:hypothetical protein